VCVKKVKVRKTALPPYKLDKKLFDKNSADLVKNMIFRRKVLRPLFK
jgi:hypothetical protein